MFRDKYGGHMLNMGNDEYTFSTCTPTVDDILDIVERMNRDWEDAQQVIYNRAFRRYVSLSIKT